MNWKTQELDNLHNWNKRLEAELMSTKNSLANLRELFFELTVYLKVYQHIEPERRMFVKLRKGKP